MTEAVKKNCVNMLMIERESECTTIEAGKGKNDFRGYNNKSRGGNKYPPRGGDRRPRENFRAPMSKEQIEMKEQAAAYKAKIEEAKKQ